MQLHRRFGDEHHCAMHIAITSSNKWSPFALVDHELPRSYVPITNQVAYVMGRGSWASYLAQVNEQKCTLLGSLLKFDSLALIPFSYAINISKNSKRERTHVQYSMLSSHMVLVHVYDYTALVQRRSHLEESCSYMYAHHCPFISQAFRCSKF